jgi:hypothetical protein
MLAVSVRPSGLGKPRTRLRQATRESKGAVPRLSDLHLPLGGPRMRPCLEDLCTFLIAEFSVDAKRDHLAHLERKRAEWRRLQTGVCVRDAPDVAARVLQDLVYSVSSPPHSGGRADRQARTLLIPEGPRNASCPVVPDGCMARIRPSGLQVGKPSPSSERISQWDVQMKILPVSLPSMQDVVSRRKVA